MAKKIVNPPLPEQKSNSEDAKRAVLDRALTDIVKRYGEGSIMRLGEAHHMMVESIPTGSLSLDIALGIGGIPREGSPRSLVRNPLEKQQFANILLQNHKN